MENSSTWQWWAGTNEEIFNFGPHESREAAIAEARADASGEFKDEDGKWRVAVYVVEATNPPLRLADFIDADRVLEYAEERLSDTDRVGSDGDEGPWFECTAEQEKDLEARIKRAADEWQSAHKLVFTCRTFLAMRNDEFVVVDHPRGDAP